MNNLSDRKFVSRLIYSVLTERLNVRDAIKNFPDSNDKHLICAYHALVHYAADEDLRYKDIEYREAQDEYLEYIAQTLAQGNPLPENIVQEYSPYYKGISHKWTDGLKGFWKEFMRYINISN